MVGIEELLQIMVQRGGSDLHITAGSPPKVRVDGSLVSTEHEVLAPDMTKKLAEQGADAIGGPPEAFAGHVRREREKWGRLVRERNIVVN